VPREELVIRSRSPFAGAKVANISPALADEMRLDPSAEGVIIIEVAEGSPAQNLGFRAGDIVSTVNNEKIARTRDLDRITKEQQRQWRVTIIRGGQTISGTFGG
jgi:S1-C subfamily serine protease